MTPVKMEGSRAWWAKRQSKLWVQPASSLGLIPPGSLGCEQQTELAHGEAALTHLHVSPSVAVAGVSVTSQPASLQQVAGAQEVMRAWAGHRLSLCTPALPTHQPPTGHGPRTGLAPVCSDLSQEAHRNGSQQGID